mgnify:CR=1 FL=1|jgi:two-component system response regulator PhoP
MRILVVEDHERLGSTLKDTLVQRKYAVDWVMDGEAGLFHGREHQYDLAIIDLGLPKLDGVSLIKELRALGKTYPILILTARSNWQDKVLGLESGADDYLVKPFINEELLARLNVLLRRAAGMASPEIRFGDLSLNTARKELKQQGKVVELTSYEYNCLEYLVLNRDKVISKTEMTEHLYDQDFDRDSNVIEVFIGRLRKKIDPDNSVKPILTVRGQGYRINADL